jgi:Fur family ferric uptake transcriptional regulator
MKKIINNRKKLGDVGLKATTQRLKLLDIFSSATKPLTAEELFKNVSKPDFDLVTVYRTILSFEKVGIIRRIDTREKSARYELADSHHHHLICVKCNDIEDMILEKDLEKQEKIISQKKKFKVLNHSLEFFGICRGCLN